MNPTMIAIAAAVYLGTAVVTWFGGDHFGYVRGVNAQKVVDKEEFDRIDNELTKQKRDANDLLQKMYAENQLVMVERDKFKTDLEKRNEENRRVTDTRRDKYADVGLRFVPTKDSGCRLGSGKSETTGRDPTSVDAPAVIQLPGTITTNLRRLVYDAEKLSNEYAKCYAYVNRKQPN
jgi:hypothetical protein